MMPIDLVEGTVASSINEPYVVLAQRIISSPYTED